MSPLRLGLVRTGRSTRYLRPIAKSLLRIANSGGVSLCPVADILRLTFSEEGTGLSTSLLAFVGFQRGLVIRPTLLIILPGASPLWCGYGLFSTARDYAQLIDVSYYALGNGSPQRDWYGVSYQATHYLEKNLVLWRYKLIGPGKSLKDCSLSQRNCPILLGMPKTAVTESVALCCNGGRRSVPFHSPIYARIGAASVYPVATGNEVRWPVAPRSAGSRCSDPPQVYLRESCSDVQFVSLV